MLCLTGLSLESLDIGQVKCQWSKHLNRISPTSICESKSTSMKLLGDGEL